MRDQVRRLLITEQAIAGWPREVIIEDGRVLSFYWAFQKNDQVELTVSARFPSFRERLRMATRLVLGNRVIVE